MPVKNNHNYLSPTLGINEVVSVVILLTIAVALSLLIFGYFYGYIRSLGYSLTDLLTHYCGLSIMGIAINATGSSITSMSIAIYNYGNSPCQISNIYVLNSTNIYQIATTKNCIVAPITVLNPGQEIILKYSNLNIPYNTNYVVEVVSCDGTITKSSIMG
ncbi:MAG: hypothetical protein ACP5NQ_01520 [Vulcanisaeta sp.]